MLLVNLSFSSCQERPSSTYERKVQVCQKPLSFTCISSISCQSAIPPVSLQRPLSRRITWEKRCNLKEKKQIRCNLVICPCVTGTSATSTAHRLSAVRHGRRRKSALSLVVGVRRRSIKQNVWNILRHDICKYLILQNTLLYNFTEQRHHV